MNKITGLEKFDLGDELLPHYHAIHPTLRQEVAAEAEVITPTGILQGKHVEFDESTYAILIEL